MAFSPYGLHIVLQVVLSTWFANWIQITEGRSFHDFLEVFTTFCLDVSLQIRLLFYLLPRDFDEKILYLSDNNGIFFIFDYSPDKLVSLPTREVTLKKVGRVAILRRVTISPEVCVSPRVKTGQYVKEHRQVSNSESR